MYTIELLIDEENEITKAALLNLWMGWLKPELQKRGKYTKTRNNQTQLDFADDGAKTLDEEFAKKFEIVAVNDLTDFRLVRDSSWQLIINNYY